MYPIVNAVSFWKEYAAQLNEGGDWEAYKKCETWTEPVKVMAEKTCKKLTDFIAEKDSDKIEETQREYFRIDVIGFRQEEPGKDNNWWLDIAYEHENSDDWDSELCKLCFVAADLRVISSYYDHSKKQKIEDYVQEYLDKLGSEKIHRVQNSQWLLIFGPRCHCIAKDSNTQTQENEKFRAFTIDNMKLAEITAHAEDVFPERWKPKS
ncbi:MAG: hypothetical protein JW936_06865 [Sedimentisphaerales bacterium]|nr:hypothetical protein [Sedimentisphaerales bacterium]